ncbi:MAG: alpha/beta hydrolase [Bacteroidia bacterium]
MDQDIIEVKIEANSYVFDCLECGNPENPLVVLLHGFPESAIVYTRLMQDLSLLGYYCIAPNLRGYSAGARPKGKSYYHLNHLTKDILEIVDSINKKDFHLIGHDWGAGIGWKLVHDYSSRILSWTALSLPHLQAFFESILTDKEQKVKSRYVNLFQIPYLPEWKLRSYDFKILRKLWSRQSEKEIATYIGICKEKYALTAMLNYYRASNKLYKSAKTQKVMGNIATPTLFIWGNRDIAIGRTAVSWSHKYMTGQYEFIELDAGHWLLQTNYEKIMNAITNHLSNHS